MEHTNAIAARMVCSSMKLNSQDTHVLVKFFFTSIEIETPLNPKACPIYTVDTNDKKIPS